MPNSQILLDTTIQLWRIVYGAEESERVHRELVDKEIVYTTSFVFREFLNTIIADLAYLHLHTSKTLQPDEEGRIALARLARFLSTGQGNYSTRSTRRLYLIIGKLLEDFETTRIPRSKLLVRLERIAFSGKLRKHKTWNWALGDLLIVLETPTGVAVYSTDRTFEILTHALNKPRYSGYRVPPVGLQ